MARTDLLRFQHDAASRMMARILGQLDHYRGRDDAYQISLSLAKLLGLLRIHLAREDGHLYPELLASGREDVRVLARRFVLEMGDLAARFELFVNRWPTSVVIAAAIAEFHVDAKAVFAALDSRIRRENEELYPLADALDEPMPGSSAA